MKVLVDMSLSPAWVSFLAGHGVDAAHWSAIGRASAADSEILEYADAHGFVVFTHDLDFGTLLAARKTRGPSVIQVRFQDVLPNSIGDIVLRALRTTQSHLESGALVTVEPMQHRIRLLPI